MYGVQEVINDKPEVLIRLALQGRLDVRAEDRPPPGLVYTADYAVLSEEFAWSEMAARVGEGAGHDAAYERPWEKGGVADGVWGEGVGPRYAIAAKAVDRVEDW